MAAQCTGARCAAGVLLLALLSPLGAVADVTLERLLLSRQRQNSSSAEPEHDYNKETKIGTVKMPIDGDNDPTAGRVVNEEMDVTVEALFAALYIATIACVPLIIRRHDPDRFLLVTIVQVMLLVVWLVTGLVLLTTVIEFHSPHWEGSRPLTMVETVYLFSQIITTVGYGDITPAYPRGQVVIGIYVLVSLLVIANTVSEVSGLVVQRVQDFTASLAVFARKASAKLAAKESDASHSARGAVPGDDEPEVAPEVTGSPSHRDSSDYLHSKGGVPFVAMSNSVQQGPDEFTDPTELKFYEKPKVDFFPLIMSGGAFFIFWMMGVLFYHYYPGEEKTWLQAVYMSVITLSTVGFGAFNATTEGGKVFGAFWMLFGVAALVSFVGAFTEFMLKLKEVEKWDPEIVKQEMTKNLEKVVDSGDRLTRYAFIKFALMQLKLASEDQLAQIEEEWDRFMPDSTGEIDTTRIEASNQEQNIAASSRG